jgi:phage baseplate assembly protein W
MGSIFKGFKFPFQKNSRSFPASSSDDQVVYDSIVQIVMTGRGERVMRPDFGCSGPRFVFENNNSILAETIRADLRTALAKYEPRAIVQSIDVDKGDDDTSVIATITFVVIATGSVLSASAPLPT